MKALLIEQTCQRAAATVAQEFARGQTTLATIAATAPLLGFFLAVRAIASLFTGGYSGERTQMLFYLAAPLAKAWMPAAWGLALGIAAHAQYRVGQARVETLTIEMRAATQILVTWSERGIQRQSPAS